MSTIFGDTIGLELKMQQIADWNSTQVSYPADVCLQELFEQQVERTPQAVAVEFEGTPLTYAELNARANQLAHHLRGLGVGADTLVGVFMERSLEMVIALYGIVKAGGAYVPIDPEYPADRVAFMLEDAAVPVLLTQSHLVGQLPARECQRLCLDTEWDRVAMESAANPVRNITAKNLAYMIYTSGSTGKPKGAMNEHRGITNRLLWMQDQYGLTAADTILQKTPFSFDVSVWEFFWPLLAGARLLVAKPGGHRDAAYLVDLIVKEQVTVLHFVPPMLRIFLEDSGVKSCVSLRHVICSGEALPYDLQEKFFNLLPAQLHNLYGPTEAAVDVTHYTCQRNGARKIVPIGRPVANTQIHILDPKLQPVAVGVTGELYIGGVQVGRGYHNRPELTAEKFIADPFRTDPDARLYKTGDECRWLSDGNIEYLGRADFQVKIRGFRIELGEIETALAGHPVVKECVVIAREDTPGEKMLVGYILPHPGASPEASDLRAHLKKDLPDYMVPSAFVLVEHFPLSPNGKLDRKALPHPDGHRLENRTEYVAPHDPLEESLARIWATSLRVKRVGRNDNFFDLGGHSLLAVRIINEIEKLYQKRLTIGTLLQAPTVGDLARALEEDEGAASSSIQRRSAKAGLEGKLGNPLSFAQEQQWFLNQLAPESPAYNIVDVIALGETYSPEALHRALQELVRRHEVLRTAFSYSGGEPVQIVMPQVGVALPEVDLSALPEPERKREWIRLVHEQGRQPFDLSRVPLFRGTLVHWSAREHKLLLTIHHIIADEWSMELIQRELTQLYRAFSQGLPSPLPELPIQYADFACWQRDWLQGAVLDRQLDYWKKDLAGAPTVLELASDKPRPAVQSFRGSDRSFSSALLRPAGAAEIAGPRGTSYSVHGVAGQFRDLPASLHRAGRPAGGHSHFPPHAC